MKTDCGEIKTIQIDEYIIPNAIDMIIGARESRKISSIVATLWNHIMYKKYKVRRIYDCIKRKENSISFIKYFFIYTCIYVFF